MKTTTVTSTLLVLSSIFISTVAHAEKSTGTFDCSVIYDEYENLMNGQYLARPGDFVGGLQNRATQNDLQAQRGVFKVIPKNSGLNVLVFKTHEGSVGKLHLRYGRPVDANGNPELYLTDIVRYDLFEMPTYFNPQPMSDFSVSSFQKVDLDSGRVSQSGENDPKSDLHYYAVGNDWILEAVNGASLYFPTESLCKAGN